MIMKYMCIEKNKYRMIALEKNLYPENVTFGYLRRFVPDYMFPPFYLVKLIHQWTFVDILHFIKCEHEKPVQYTQIELIGWKAPCNFVV